MVRLNKSKLPPNTKIESEADYRSGVVLNTLVKDCYEKCYICEDKSTTINVEHLIPHHNDTVLKYDWNNLFMSCGHCNSIKHLKYNNILNPTKCDPEDHIDLSIEITDNLIEKVVVQALTKDSSTIQTAKLLNLVYNGGSTAIKDIECSNLRNAHLLPDIRKFLQYLNDYLEEPDIGCDKMIIKEIDRSSAFAAFKRRIIRRNPELLAKFKNYLN